MMRAFCQRRHIVSLVLIAAAALSAYGNSLSGAFLWDDEPLVLQNSSIRGWAHLGDVLTQDIGRGARREFHFLRPVQMMTYALDWHLWKDDPRGYHLTNLFFHIAAAAALYSFIVVVFADSAAAFLTAVFFVVHPAHAASVSYVSGRADLLAAFFLFAALTACVRAADPPATGPFATSLVFYFLALFSKEGALVLPLLLTVVFWVLQKKIERAHLVFFLTLTFFYIFLRLTFLRSVLPHFSYPAFFSGRLPGFFAALTRYLQILLFPSGLHMEYGAGSFSFSDPRVFFGMAVFLCLSAAAWMSRRRQKVVTFSIVWFFIALLPYANFYPLNAYMAEHWLYVPSLGFFLVLAAGLGRCFRNTRVRTPAAVGASALLIFYACATVRQNGYWRNPLVFYETTLRYAPRSTKMLNNLGILYMRIGREREGIELFRKAVDVRPREAIAYNNLCGAYGDTGRMEEALGFCRRAVEIDPSYADAFHNLCRLLMRRGRPEEAASACRRAVEADASCAAAYDDLGFLSWRAGRPEEAEGFFLKAAEADAYFVPGRIHLGTLYLQQGRVPEAVDVLERAVALEKRSAQAFGALGVAYAAAGRRREAEAAFLEAVRISPADGAAYGNLSLFYLQAGRDALARACYAKARGLGFVNEVLEHALDLRDNKT